MGEAPGDEGHALTVGTRYDLPFMPSRAAPQLAGFFDTGWVKLHDKPWEGAASTSSGRNDDTLSGGGLGVHSDDGRFWLQLVVWLQGGQEKGWSRTGRGFYPGEAA